MDNMYEGKGLTSEEKRVRTIVTTTYNNKLAIEKTISNLIEQYQIECAKLSYITNNRFQMHDNINDTNKVVETYIFGHEVNDYLKDKNISHYGIEDLKLYSLTYEYETGRDISDLKVAFNIYDLIREIKKERGNISYIITSGLSNVFDKSLLSEYKENLSNPKKVLKTKEELIADQNKLTEKIEDLKINRGILDGANAKYASSLIKDLYNGYYYELERVKDSINEEKGKTK